jgi:NADH dehydrogenase/NADH:ubiquinone oxidoreductase subunit G
VEDLGRETDILVVFGPYLAERFSLPEVKTALAGVETKVLLTPKINGLEALFDLVLPVAYPAEKSGSFVNGDGLLQSFAAALEPAEAVKSEGQVLASLGRGLGINPGFYQRAMDPPAVLADIRKEFPFFT